MKLVYTLLYVLAISVLIADTCGWNQGQVQGGRGGRSSGKKNVDDNKKNWWKKIVFYQIYPRSFQDSDGDGVGDLKGIMTRVDYVKYAGFGAVWLSPIYESPMKDFGYDIANYTKIDPLFGTMDDFKKLNAEVKSKGLKLVMDFVPNHTSNTSTWFQNSRRRIEPYTDFYVWVNGTGPDGREVPNNWLSMFGGSAWQWDPLREQFYYHQFLVEQPDLNFRNPKVRDAIKDVLRYWFKNGVDGFRIDAVKHLFEDEKLRDEPLSHDPTARPGEYNSLLHIYTTSDPKVLDMIAEWRQVFNEFEKQDGLHRVMIVEINETIAKTVEYYGNASFPMADMPMNFELFKIDNKSSVQDIYKIIKNWLDGVPKTDWPNWIIGNHDQPRVANRTFGELVDGFNMVNLLLKGTPITYYGEEIGMVDTFITWEQTRDPPGLWYGKDRYQKFSRDPERTPMQWDDTNLAGFSKAKESWLPVNPNYHNLNVEKEKEDGRSHLSTFRRLIELRRDPSILYGEVEYPIVTDNIFAFTRAHKQGSGIVVLINFGSQAETTNLNEKGKVSGFKFPKKGRLAANSNNIENDSNLSKIHSIVTLNSIELKPKQAVVIKFHPIWPTEAAS